MDVRRFVLEQGRASESGWLDAMRSVMRYMGGRGCGRGGDGVYCPMGGFRRASEDEEGRWVDSRRGLERLGDAWVVGEIA